MKNKITRKLVLYFVSVLLLFSLLAGMLFSMLFARQSGYVYRTDLQKRATAIADTFSEYIKTDTTATENGRMPAQGQRQGSGGFGMYLRFVSDVAMSDVWIVDQTAQTVTVGSGRNTIRYSELPKETIAIVTAVFDSGAAYSEDHGSLFEVTAVTVGAPIFAQDGQVIAAVILHTDAGRADAALVPGLSMLGISLTIALVLSIIIAIFVSKRFVRPLKSMENVTKKLTNGEYTTQTHIRQDDEVGSLAKNIDILAKRLNAASKESIVLEQMRKDYVANISHELRTPVTVMRASLEALYDDVITEPGKIKEYHKQLLSESIHLERMVNDLLELSRLQNPDYVIEKAKLNFPEVLEDAVRSIKHMAANKGIDIHSEFDARDFVIMGDYGRLRQMFIAVLDNAIKFSDVGQNVVIRTWNQHSNCFVSITDRGKGIKADELSHVFERFFKANHSNNQKGTGLGLSIAKHIADRHGITLEVTSTQKDGTVFVFTATAAQ